mgnify:CR=1 FL=1
MATPQEIQKLLNELQSAYNTLGKTNPFANFDTSNISNASNIVLKLQSSLRGVNKQIQDISEGVGDIVSIFQSTVNEISKSNNALNNTKKVFNSLTSLAKDLRNDQEGIKRLNEKELKTIIEKATLQKRELSDVKIQLEQRKQQLIEENQTQNLSLSIKRKNREEILKLNSALQATNEEYKGGEGFSQELITAAKDRLDLEKKIGKNYGAKGFSALSDLTKSIPGLRKLAEPFSDASDAASGMARGIEEAAKSGGKGLTTEKIKQLGLEKTLGNLSGNAAASKLKGMGSFNKGILSAKAGFKALGPLIQKTIAPLALFTAFGEALLEADKQVVGIQKSMALSSEEAVAFRGELTSAAAASTDINITSSKLLKNFSALNKQFGFITNFASSTLVTMTKLTDVIGISSESAGNLAAASTLTGSSFDSNYKDALGTSYELQRQEGVQMDLRDILEQTGKVTGTVRANLGANPANIAKAITQAKLFGASLQQVSSAGKTLLDFESSITAELEAELLLGRDINLEKARLAALNGDQVTLAKELRREAGDFTEFTSMNVLQQEALAKSLGMQSDELADILFQQDVQNKTAKELRDLGKDELADRLEKQTAGEKFNATIEKLKDILVDVFSALSPILNVFSSILKVVGFIVAPIGALIGAANKLDGVLGGVVGLLMAAAIAAITLGSGLTLGLGVAGIVAGSLAGIAILNSNKAEAIGDINSPANGKTQISTKEGGLFELSKNDDIVAFPGASRAMSQGGQSSQPIVMQSDNTESKKTNQLLQQILSKQGTIKLDSTDMGTAMSVNRYAIQ